MSDWSMLIWLTQLGLSVVLPLAGMTGLAIWLCGKFQLGRCSDWHFAGVCSCCIRLQKYSETNGIHGEAQERFPFSKKKKAVTGGAYGNPKDCFARNGNHCNR